MGAGKSQTFRYEGGKFVKSSEVAQKPQAVVASGTVPGSANAGSQTTHEASIRQNLPPLSKARAAISANNCSSSSVAIEALHRTSFRRRTFRYRSPKMPASNGSCFSAPTSWYSGQDSRERQYAFVSIPQFAAPGSVRGPRGARFEW